MNVLLRGHIVHADHKQVMFPAGTAALFSQDATAPAVKRREEIGWSWLRRTHRYACDKQDASDGLCTHPLSTILSTITRRREIRSIEIRVATPACKLHPPTHHHAQSLAART